MWPGPGRAVPGRTHGAPQGGSFPQPVGSPQGRQRKAGPISETPPLCFCVRAPVPRVAVVGCLVTQGPSADLSARPLVSLVGLASPGGDFVAVLRGPELCCPTWSEDLHHRARPWQGHRTASEGQGQVQTQPVSPAASCLPGVHSAKGTQGSPATGLGPRQTRGLEWGRRRVAEEKWASQWAEGRSGIGRTPLVAHG